jgi:hypothetical protein
MCRHSRTLPIEQPANLSQPSYGATYENHAFLHPAYIATCELPFYKVFTRENTTSFLKKSSSPFSLQELKTLTPLKATYRFTSLTVIGMTKIMCNTWTKAPPTHQGRPPPQYPYGSLCQDIYQDILQNSQLPHEWVWPWTQNHRHSYKVVQPLGLVSP